jgi:hypothetical protein
MIEQFLQQLLTSHVYTPELILLYVITGILAGLTRLSIRDGYKAQIRSWWDDGSLLGAIIVSVTGALLFDNNFVWAFLGGYFLTYILSFIQKKLEGASKRNQNSGEGNKEDDVRSNDTN